MTDERDPALELSRDVLWLELRSTPRFVLLVLAIEARRALASLSIRECAARTSLTSGTIIRALRELERDGWISRLAVHDRELGQQPNCYRIHDARVRSHAVTARAAERRRLEGGT